MALTECPKCGNVFDNKGPDGITDAGCPKCAKFASPPQQVYATAPPTTAPPAAAPPEASPSRPAENPHVYSATPSPALQNFTINFTGSGGEYFKIWIVNSFLSIITFGLYSAWAKVRTRKYFFANTMLAGGTFSYDGPPWAILRGRLIIGALLMLFALSGRFHVIWLYFLLMGVFVTAYPFLIYKSLRFNLHHTLFRNIRFRFLGSLGESYLINMLFNLLWPVTLAILLPFTEYRRQRYYFGNIAFGNGTSSFKGKARFFYAYYGVAALIFALFLPIFGFSFAGIATLMNGIKTGPPNPENIGFIILFLLVAYGIFFVMFTTLKTFFFVKLTNYSLKNTTLGNVTFTSSLRFWPLLFIAVTNLLAVACSVGFLSPWAKVRQTRYCLSRIMVTAPGGLDGFISADAPDDSAIGEAAAEYFDFELGL